jgi:hypothetical protein
MEMALNRRDRAIWHWDGGSCSVIYDERDKFSPGSDGGSSMRIFYLFYSNVNAPAFESKTRVGKEGSYRYINTPFPGYSTSLLAHLRLLEADIIE